ncbi:drug/metabolite exporter YedA [bacterium]|nr:drug/metabolite exporter YedA [bacterium]
MPTEGRNRTLIALALLAVYIIWGSTYLGIKFAIEGFPPLIMNGIRFVAAGALLYVWARHRGRAHPTARQWRNAAAIGAILLIGGVGLVSVAEDLGVGSGLAASLIAVMPLWGAVIAGLWGDWPRGMEWAGLAVGLCGVMLLSREGDFSTTTTGLVLMIISPILWAFGSIWSTKLDLPRGAMATAAEMLTGGAALLVVGWIGGERVTEMPGPGAWLALLYLITIGSFVAYGSYMFLLEHTRPAVSTSYAYVNPVVAVILGITLGAEVVSGWTFGGLPLVLMGVGLVGLAQRRAAPTQGAAAGPTKDPS